MPQEHAIGLIQKIINVDFIATLVFLYFFIFLRANDAFEHSINMKFRHALWLVLLLAVIDNVFSVLQAVGASLQVQKVVLLTGYAVRPYTLMTSIYILHRRNLSNKRSNISLIAPATVNAIFLATSPLWDKAFWSPAAEIPVHPTIYFNSTHILSLHYLVIVIIFIVKQFKRGAYEEAWLLVVATSGIFLSITGEQVLDSRGLFLSANLMMYAFHYLYLHIEHFKRDPLTGALNRMSFFADLSKLKEKDITAFCEIDMNGLKAINDTQGHAAGDKAIVTLASAITETLPPKSKLYRLGGDEFAILFTHTSASSISDFIKNINGKMGQSSYSCAIGVAEWKEGMPFEEIYALADRRMYANKKEQKERMASQMKRQEVYVHLDGFE